MDWFSLLAGGLAGAVLGGVVSLWNGSRDRKRIDERLRTIDLPHLELEQARFELERTAGARDRELAAYDELLAALGDMTVYMNTRMRRDEDVHTSTMEFLGRADAAVTKVKVSGSPNVRYFAVQALQEFHEFGKTVWEGSPIEAFADQFVNSQLAVQDLVRFRQQRLHGETAPP